MKVLDCKYVKCICTVATFGLTNLALLATIQAAGSVTQILRDVCVDSHIDDAEIVGL